MNQRQLSSVFVGLCLAFILLPVSIFAQQESKPSYESLLERVKKSDPSVSFMALRYAYADDPPKNNEAADPEASKKMFAAFNSKDYGKAIEYAEEIMKGNFVDINAHIIAAAAYREKNNAEKEKFHRYVGEGLIKSILASGDGKSQETAFVVISTGEEYVILRVFGLMIGSQSLLSANGHHYDRLDATDPKTKEKVSLYFNIDRPYGALEKIFKQ